MPPPKFPDPTDPAEWLLRAESDLAMARVPRGSPKVLYEALCFHAQQAAEMAIKALLVGRSRPFPKPTKSASSSLSFTKAGKRFPATFEMPKD